MWPSGPRSGTSRRSASSPTEAMDLPFGEAVRHVLDARFQAREEALAAGRKLIRASANAIRALHREEWDGADALLSEAGEIYQSLASTLSSHPDLFYSGFVSDSAKEYAEARITSALFREQPIPTHDEMAMDPVPFLHGLAESVGELRRRLLDLLRGGRLDEAETVMADMDEIVDLLAEMDYPDGMTAGLRRATDVSRALVERSRSDLTATVAQERLREDLRRLS